MCASGFHNSIFSGWCKLNKASMASCATSHMICWWTSETRPLMSSSVELWISWPAFPGLWSIRMGSAWMRRTIHSNKCLWLGHSSAAFSLNLSDVTFSLNVKLWKGEKLSLCVQSCIWYVLDNIFPCSECHWALWVNTASDNGLVLPGNKPLPEPMLTQIYVTIWRQ